MAVLVNIKHKFASMPVKQSTSLEESYDKLKRFQKKLNIMNTQYMCYDLQVCNIRALMMAILGRNI
jgi:hypothetical protein